MSNEYQDLRNRESKRTLNYLKEIYFIFLNNQFYKS